MATGLDDVLQAIKETNELLIEIRDSGGAGGGGGSSTAAGRGKARSGPGGALSFLTKGGPMKAIAAGMKGARMASNALDSMGITAGLRASNLGASQGEAIASGQRALLNNATSLPFAGFALANTRQELNAQNDAQGNVTGLLDQFALAGGTRDGLDQGGVDTMLGRQNELQRNKHDIRRMVSDRQAVVGQKDLAAAVGKDAGNLSDQLEPFSALSKELQLLVHTLRQVNSATGGVR